MFEIRLRLASVPTDLVEMAYRCRKDGGEPRAAGIELTGTWAPNLALDFVRLYGGNGGLAPAAQLRFGGRYGHGCVVDFGGVVVDGSGGLGAEVADSHVEVESTDAVFALGAGELHAALDAMNLVGFH